MPSYDYFCDSCLQTWTEFYKMADRKTPEKLPCPKCGVARHVQQTIAYTAVPVSATMEADRALKKLNNSAFAEKLNQIHRETPGSNLASSSTIVDVK